MHHKERQDLRFRLRVRVSCADFFAVEQHCEQAAVVLLASPDLIFNSTCAGVECVVGAQVV